LAAYHARVAERAHVLIVEDAAPIAASIDRWLRHVGCSAEVAEDGQSALDRACRRKPDLVLLDVMLPGLDGIEVCRRLRASGDVPILMLTARDAIADRVRGLDAGADDYLVKPFAPEELMARVRALFRRRAPGSPALLKFADLEMDLAAREVRREGREIQLTATEFDLLQHFLRHPRVVLSRDRLLEAVWGYDSDLGSNVVDVYVGYVRSKLGEPRLVHTVRGVGYVLRAP